MAKPGPAQLSHNINNGEVLCDCMRECVCACVFCVTMGVTVHAGVEGCRCDCSRQTVWFSVVCDPQWLEAGRPMLQPIVARSGLSRQHNYFPWEPNSFKVFCHLASIGYTWLIKY